MYNHQFVHRQMRYLRIFGPGTMAFIYMFIIGGDYFASDLANTLRIFNYNAFFLNIPSIWMYLAGFIGAWNGYRTYGVDGSYKATLFVHLYGFVMALVILWNSQNDNYIRLCGSALFWFHALHEFDNRTGWISRFTRERNRDY